MSEVASNKEQKIFFLQGNESLGGETPLISIKQKISEFSNIKNINFLFGSGTSSGAIPSMNAMHVRITEEIEREDEEKLSSSAKTLYNNITENNIEIILSVLYSKKYFLEGSSGYEENELLDVISLIEYIENSMYLHINVDFENAEAIETLELYSKFYQKVSLRNKDLARVNIFTTNNDLFNENALDKLNINYNNGFGGGIERVFNPARFHYTFSKKIDSNLEKFEPLENMVYLYKLHGSISWMQNTKNSLFNIQEVFIEGGVEKNELDHVLIYPTPLKQSQSLGSPYSDLIREFQTKLSQPNSVLFVIGYSFNDEHLNNIIYQSIASNSSISIIIFGKYEECPLSTIADSRIYRVYGEDESGEKVHYFKYITNDLLPCLDENKEKVLLDDFMVSFKEVIKAESKI